MCANPILPMGGAACCGYKSWDLNSMVGQCQVSQVYPTIPMSLGLPSSSYHNVPRPTSTQLQYMEERVTYSTAEERCQTKDSWNTNVVTDYGSEQYVCDAISGANGAEVGWAAYYARLATRRVLLAPQ